MFNPADAPSPRGWKARTAAAAARRAAEAARRAAPETLARAAHIALATEDFRLTRIVSEAGDHLDKLVSKLAAARSQLANMAEAAYKSGDIRVDAAKVRAQVDGLPALIARAEQELAEARDALAAHRARVADAQAVVAVVEPQAIEVETVEVETEPVNEPARGRGRPRKVAA